MLQSSQKYFYYFEILVVKSLFKLNANLTINPSEATKDICITILLMVLNVSFVNIYIVFFFNGFHLICFS